jgi:hypothetical protein
MKTDKMNVQTFATNCIKYDIEFELTHYELEGWDEYCVHIILGNSEYIVPAYDEYKLAKIWREILEYYIY